MIGCKNEQTLSLLRNVIIQFYIYTFLDSNISYFSLLVTNSKTSSKNLAEKDIVLVFARKMVPKRFLFFQKSYVLYKKVFFWSNNFKIASSRYLKSQAALILGIRIAKNSVLKKILYNDNKLPRESNLETSIKNYQSSLDKEENNTEYQLTTQILNKLSA